MYFTGSPLFISAGCRTAGTFLRDLLSKLFHHPVAGEEFGVLLNLVVESDARSTVAEMDRMPHVRVGWDCGLHRCIRKTQTLRLSYRPLTSTILGVSE